MGIQMIGMDHNSAGIEARERFSFTKKQREEALSKIDAMNNITGTLILSTCNRTEIWWSSFDDCKEAVYALLWELKEVDGNPYKAFFRERDEQEAIDHLFKLTAGLKSQVLGEDQILSQVKEAVALAREQYTMDNLLEVLFRMAITAGKKVKTEVPLSHGNTSLAHKAIMELGEDGYLFKGKKALVIGNGEMGRLAATLLREEGVNVTVTIRQYRSGVLKIPHGCERINYGERYGDFSCYDLVVSATASPNYTLTYEAVSHLHLEKEMILLDLALPRDIEPKIGELKGITLYDVDHFGREVNEDIKQSLQAVEAILEKQKEEFIAWYQNRDVLDKLGEVRNLAMEDFERRLEKVFKKLAVEEDSSQLQEDTLLAAGKIMNKMIFGLRNTVSQEAFRECVEGLEKIYRVD